MGRAIPFFAIAALLLAACGDDTVKPGQLLVKWSHGPTPTCESRHVVEIEARAYLKGELRGSMKTSCPSADQEGELAIADLKPGNYDVVVEALDSGGVGRYIGRADRQAVKEDQATETVVIRLDQKPVRLQVTWTTPSGMCAGSAVREVRVQVLRDPDTTGDLVAELEVPCASEVEDPDDPDNLLAGVLFTDLDPDDEYKIFAYGLNQGGDEIAKGESDKLQFGAGDSDVVNIELETCPGDPPACD